MIRHIEKLTDAQRDLVEQNYRLALMAAWRRVRCGDGLVTKYGYDIGDMIEMAYDALCCAACMFDADRGVQFSTCFMAVVKSYYRDAAREMNACARKPPGGSVYSLDDCINGMPIVDCITSRDEGVHERMARIERNRALVHAIGRLDVRSRKVLAMYVNGKRQREIAEFFGIGQSYVSRILITARKKLREALAAEEYGSPREQEEGL